MVADDHLEGQTITDTTGSYRLLVSGVVAPGPDLAFEVGASKQGYKDDWKRLSISDPTCTWNNSKCDLVANFTLMPQ